MCFSLILLDCGDVQYCSCVCSASPPLSGILHYTGNTCVVSTSISLKVLAIETYTSLEVKTYSRIPVNDCTDINYYEIL